MEQWNTSRPLRVGNLLAKMRADHALSVERLAGLLGISVHTLLLWERDGLPVAPAVEAKIVALLHRLDGASLEAWKFRVSAATRPELLMDDTLTVVSVSPSMLLQRAFEENSKVVLPLGFFVGRHINDILPSLDCNMLLTRGTGLSELHDIGLFERRVRCVRVAAELNFGTLARNGVGEFWPVETVDRGIACQLILHSDPSAKNQLRVPGVIVHWTQIIPAEEAAETRPIGERVNESQ